MLVPVGFKKSTDIVDKDNPAVPRHCPKSVPTVPEKGFLVLKSSGHGQSPMRRILAFGFICEIPSVVCSRFIGKKLIHTPITQAVYLSFDSNFELYL
jgi:hypothetical protein